MQFWAINCMYWWNDDKPCKCLGSPIFAEYFSVWVPWAIFTFSIIPLPQLSLATCERYMNGYRVLIHSQWRYHMIYFVQQQSWNVCLDHFLMVADHYTWITILGCLDHIVYIVRCFIVLFQSSTGHYTWTGHAAVKGGWPPKRLVDLTRPIAYNALNLFGAVYCSSKQIPIVTHFQRYTETYGIR